MLDKRLSPRYRVHGECSLKIIYQRDNPRSLESRTLKATIKNASEGGLCLETKGVFREGDLADCNFKLGGKLKSSTLGLVKWHAPGKGVGIEFFHGSEDDRDNLQKDVRGSLPKP